MSLVVSLILEDDFPAVLMLSKADTEDQQGFLQTAYREYSSPEHDITKGIPKKEGYRLESSFLHGGHCNSSFPILTPFFHEHVPSYASLITSLKEIHLRPMTWILG